VITFVILCLLINHQQQKNINTSLEIKMNAPEIKTKEYVAYPPPKFHTTIDIRRRLEHLPDK